MNKKVTGRLGLISLVHKMGILRRASGRADIPGIGNAESCTSGILYRLPLWLHSLDKSYRRLRESFTVMSDV